MYLCKYKCMHHVCGWDILWLTSSDISVQVMAALHSAGCHNQVPTFLRAPSVVLHRVDVKGISLPRIRSLCDEQCTVKTPERCSTSSLPAAVCRRTPGTRIRKATEKVTANTVEPPTAASVRDESAACGTGHKAVEHKSLASSCSKWDTRCNTGKCDSVHKSADVRCETVLDQKSSYVPVLASSRGEGNSTASPRSSKQLSTVAKVKKRLRKPGACWSAKVAYDRCKSITRASQRGRNRVTSVRFLHSLDDKATLKERSRKRKRDGVAGSSPVKKRRKLNNSVDEVYCKNSHTI